MGQHHAHKKATHVNAPIILPSASPRMSSSDTVSAWSHRVGEWLLREWSNPPAASRRVRDSAFAATVMAYTRACGCATPTCARRECRRRRTPTPGVEMRAMSCGTTESHTSEETAPEERLEGEAGGGVRVCAVSCVHVRAHTATRLSPRFEGCAHRRCIPVLEPQLQEAQRVLQDVCLEACATLKGRDQGVG